MNTVITSRDTILTVCREFVRENGLNSLNMRTIAAKCNISVGSIYNYFPSKDDLTTAVVENIWQNIFHTGLRRIQTDSFTEYVRCLFLHVGSETRKYPGFFTSHAMNFSRNSRSSARSLMEEYFTHMEQNLLAVLIHDTEVRPDLFTSVFSAEELVSFTLSNLIALWNTQQESCTFLLEMLRRVLYS